MKISFILRKIAIIICLIIIITSVLPISNFSLADGESEETQSDSISQEQMKNSASIMVTDSSISANQPEFYGTVGITLRAGDKLDLNNSVFRIFAKDYLNEDLTHNIKIVESTINIEDKTTTLQNTQNGTNYDNHEKLVDTSNIGEYYIKYEVADSIGNTQQITVPIKITENEDRIVQKKLYSEEKSYMQELAGMCRGERQDRQNLGLLLKAGGSFQVKQINSKYSGDEIKVEVLNDDSKKEEEIGNVTISDEWTTVTSSNYDGVPFIKTYDMVANNEDYYANGTIDKYMSALQIDALVNIKAIDENDIESVDQDNNRTLYFSNIYETKRPNEIIKQVNVPTYKCSELEIYISEIDDNGNVKGYKSVAKKSLNKTTKRLETIYLDKPATINSKKFIVAVKYTGEGLCFNYISDEQDKQTYISSELTNNWTNTINWKTSNQTNIHNISIGCVSAYKDTSKNPIIEVNINDIYNENSKVKPLTYYLNGDDENEFRAEWDENNDSFAVMENNRVTFLVPLVDKDNMLRLDSEHPYCFSSIKDIFDFYNQVFEKYDSFLGVEQNAENIINENNKAKYFIKPNIHGAGAAYYTSGCIGNTADNISPFFEKNWAVLHEIAHGYEGYLTSRDVNLREAGNNIFAYYMQETFVDPEGNYGNFLHMFEKEKDFAQVRNDIQTFNDIDNLNDLCEKYPELAEQFKKYVEEDKYKYDFKFECKLYFLINMINTTDTQKAVSTLYKNMRINTEQNLNMSVADLLVTSFSDASGYNLVRYFDSWKVPISDEVRNRLNKQGNSEAYYIIELAESEEQARQVCDQYGYDGIYSLISREEFERCIGITVTKQNSPITGEYYEDANVRSFGDRDVMEGDTEARLKFAQDLYKNVIGKDLDISNEEIANKIRYQSIQQTIIDILLPRTYNAEPEEFVNQLYKYVLQRDFDNNVDSNYYASFLYAGYNKRDVIRLLVDDNTEFKDNVIPKYKRVVQYSQLFPEQTYVDYRKDGVQELQTISPEAKLLFVKDMYKRETGEELDVSLYDKVKEQSVYQSVIDIVMPRSWACGFEDFVGVIYHAVLGTSPDEEVMKHLVSELCNEESKCNVIKEFLNRAEVTTEFEKYENMVK